MSKSTFSRGIGKPQKPYPDFPLFPHANGLWAKKIRGKLIYFGPWRDHDGALQRYLDQRDDLHAGRTPRKTGDGVTIRDLANHFLAAKEALTVTGELTRRSFGDYVATCARIVEAFGLRRLVSDLAAEDFQGLRASIGKVWGPTALGNEVQRVRVVFKYGYDAGLIDKPMRYGPTFKRPSMKVMRKVREEKGLQMFEAAQVRSMLEIAPVQLRAMVMLGLNAALGNHDIGTLPSKAIDMERGWLSFARPKTGIKRRAALWPETLVALRDAIASRVPAKDETDADLVFLTRCGQRWSNGSKANPISREFRKLLDKLGMHRDGLGFYGLRHTFPTVADETRDFPAIDLIMGHTDPSMAARYRERIDDGRLLAVSDYVHDWLFEPKAKPR